MADLVRRALASDQTALARLVAVLTPVIQARVTRTLRASGCVVRQEVEDLSQDVFLELFARDAHVLRSWQAERGLSLENFVGLVAKRQVLSFLRNDRRNPRRREDPSFTVEELKVETLGSGLEKEVASRELLGLLLDRLHEELSPLGWWLFKLLFVQGRSLKEVRAVSGLSAVAVYAWRSRLRHRARKLLAEMSGNPGPPRKT